MSIVQNILKIAKEQNLNTNSSKIYDWKVGKSKPSADDVFILADYFNVSIDYLVGRTDEQTPSANNINSSFVQSNGSVTLGSVSVGSTFNSNSNAPSLSQEETEILDIYRKLNIRGKAQFLNMALEIEKGIGREF